MSQRPDYYEDADWSLIPPHMHDGVVGYVMKGWRPGGFMEAVLTNDFKGSYTQADMENLYALRGWAQFVMAHIPAMAQGTEKRFEDWIKVGGIEGLRKLAEAEARSGSDV